MGGWVHITVVWNSENKFQEFVLFSYCVGPGVELGSSEDWLEDSSEPVKSIGCSSKGPGLHA